MAINWKSVPRMEATKTIGEINPHLGEYAFPVASSQLRMASLPFYERFKLYEITDQKQNPPVGAFILHLPGGEHDSTYPLDGSNRPIYAVNEIAPLKLTDKTVTDYLGFFFACVQGPHGPMTIIESLDPQNVDKPEDEAALKELAPPRLIGMTDKGAYEVQAAMLFKDCIFKTKIEVSKSGFLQITHHELAVGGLESDAPAGSGAETS
jgi:hypothetical protein